MAILLVIITLLEHKFNTENTWVEPEVSSQRFMLGVKKPAKSEVHQSQEVIEC